jgi:hypothetical protein
MGHQHNRPRVTWLLDHKINLALTQLALKQAEHFDFFGKWLVCRNGRWTHQQINVATFFTVVHTRTKYPDRSARTKSSRGGLSNGLDLIGVRRMGGWYSSGRVVRAFQKRTKVHRLHCAIVKFNFERIVARLGSRNDIDVGVVHFGDDLISL